MDNTLNQNQAKRGCSRQCPRGARKGMVKLIMDVSVDW